MSESGIERKPLDVSTFPANLQNHVKPESPPPLKMMAARGMVPTPSEFSTRLLYQLSFDADVGSEARGALEQMPPAILIPSHQSEQPAAVLDWIAEVRLGDEEVLQAVVLNKGAADETIAAIAAAASSALCDVIANNQVRILRHPAILEALYQNTNARMATIDKLIDLVRRNDVKLTGLPGLQGALDAGEDLVLDAGDAGEVEDFLREQAQEAELEQFQQGEEEEKPMSRLEQLKRMKQPEQEEEDEPVNPSLYARIHKMNLAQKIRLATVGNREAINLLVKESNRLVHMAAIKSPRLQFADIRKLSSNKSIADGVIRYIANNREWTQHYEIKLNLVNNPKTPLADAISMVNHLRTNDLRMLMRNRNVPHQLARQAKTLVNKRSS